MDRPVHHDTLLMTDVRFPEARPMAGEVYLEFVSVGRMVKVVAVDPKSGLESTIVAPAATPRSDLERLAVRKLKRLIARKT